ncbi:MAG: response regulator [Candidatus Competibacteraceae bacterium]
MNAPSSIERLLTWMAGGLAVLVMVAPPTAFFLWSYQSRSGALQSESQLLASVVTEFVNQSTNLWRFQPERLTSLLQQYGNQQYGSAVIDQEGTVIAHRMPELDRPTLTHSHPIYDFGVEVGEVQVVASLRDLLTETAWIVLAGTILGIALFFPLGFVPARALRRTTQALMVSENAYRQLVELSPDMIFISRDEKIIYINTAGARMFGADSPSALLGSSVWDRLHPDCHEVVRERIRNHTIETVITLLEERCVRMDGTVFPVEMAAAPFVYRGRLALQVVAHDLSDRKQTEAALRNAKEAAETANRAKSEFLATMSHEIRTPLNGVLGMTELLRDTPLNTQQQRFVDMILRSSHALLATINDILDFSKIESGRMELEVVPFDLRELMEETAALLAERAHEKGLELINDLPFSLPASAQGDPVRLRQILVNLVSNAIKFTKRGEVVMRLRVLAQDASGLRLCFEVQDTGIGIAPAACTRIFDAFTQADGSTTRHYGGTGLGLAIVRRLVRLMEGEIGVDSTPEVGSRFWFTLLLSQPTLRLAASMRLPWPAQQELRGLRVLLVDDNATNREMMRRQTAAWGLVSDEAENGTQALLRLRDAARTGKRHDLAFLDLRMPELDGLELAREIRADPTLAGLKLVLLSSSGMDTWTGQATQADIQGVLYKPVRQAELYKILCRLLGRAADPNSRLRALPTTGSSQFTGRVLVAEDNPVNQEMALAVLRALGCQVEVVANGQEAVEAVARTQYDLLFMDCQMPVLDGFAATAAIRHWEQVQGRPRLPIIALTANVVKGFREQCLAAGMDDYLSKPFTQEQLVTVLDSWLLVEESNSLMPASRLPPVSSRSPTASAAITAADPEVAAPVNPNRRSSPGRTVSPLDERALAQIRALQRPGQPSVLGGVIDLYLDNAPTLLQQMREAITAGDGEALYQAAHGFKSSSATLGATRLAAVCEDLERRGRNRCLEDTSALLWEADRRYMRVREALVVEMEKERQ